MALIVLGTSMWVLSDALRSGKKISAWGWFFVCLVIWIIGFPLYLYKRADYIADNTKN
jgi:hypothetical protein